jgi:hypothetical protein
MDLLIPDGRPLRYCAIFTKALWLYKIMPAAQEREQHIKSATAAAATATAAKGVCIFISKQHT